MATQSEKTALSKKSEAILAQALNLPLAERVGLLEELVSNLHPIDPKIEAAMAREAEDRIDAYDHGEIEAIPAEEVFARVLDRKRT